jgi:hypothetical protein
MFLPPHRFPFTRALEAGFPVFRREWEGLTEAEFCLWPVTEAYRGAWLVFPLFETSLPAGIDFHVARNRARCPESVRLLTSIPGLVGAGFSTMTPGTRILPHADAKDPLLIRCHLGIETHPAARIRVRREVRSWESGKCLLFDGFLEHETENDGVKPRTVLLTDFRLDSELARDMGLLRAPSAGPGVPVRAEGYGRLDAVRGRAHA